jgi:hypothetical protein
MKCENCGFSPDEPLGKSLTDSDKEGNVMVQLNQNGRLWIMHRTKCLGLPIVKMEDLGRE